MKKAIQTFRITVVVFLTGFISLIGSGQVLRTKPVGVWSGKLLIQGSNVDLIFSILANEKGELTAKLDVPAQGAKNLPVNRIISNNDSLIFYVDVIQGRFSGAFKNDTTVKGKWIQGDSKLPITLTKNDKIPLLNRPQNPRKPYPYVEQEVVYENKKARIKIAGTLTIPNKDGVFPAVILIPGSGVQDRDETIMGHKPFLVLSHYLTLQGIAVLRVDDRGIGGSGGKKSESTAFDLAGDVLAGIEFLKTQKSINPARIGLIGHSEGGIIAPIAANMSKDVAFVLTMAGPGIVGEQILYKQGELINRASGASESQIEENRKFQKALFDILKDKKDTSNIHARLYKVFASTMKTPIDEKQKATIDIQINSINTPWFKFFLTYDPAPALEKVKCPILALLAQKDLQVPIKENFDAIDKAFIKGGNKKAVALEITDLNHLFQVCETGTISEYGQIEETIAPKALSTIYSWIHEAVK
jgi:uncharacterized protein